MMPLVRVVWVQHASVDVFAAVLEALRVAAAQCWLRMYLRWAACIAVQHLRHRCVPSALLTSTAEVLRRGVQQQLWF
jgi:hypothetical protein